MSLPFFEDGDKAGDFTAVDTIGSFSGVNKANDFDTIFEEACDNLEQTHHMKFTGDFLKLDNLTDGSIPVADFKSDLMSPFEESVSEAVEKMENYQIKGINAGNVAGYADQLSTLFDNKIRDFEESASVGSLLPVKTIDMPIMIKNHIQNSFKDIVNEEITPSIVVKKQIEQTVVYAKKDPSKTWNYPQCFFDDTFQEMVGYGEGTKLSTTAVALPLFNYDIVENLTDAAIASNQRIVADIEITKVEDADGKVITLATPMRVNLADGAWIGGKINQTYKVADKEKELNDVLSGFMDFTTNTTTLSSAAGAVKKVYFSGKLSNEGNENTVRFSYKRRDIEWHVGEGFKVDAAYTLEELQEHKAMLNFDLYTRSYNDLQRLITDMEDSKGYQWLDEEFEKYDGVELDPLMWNPLILKTQFDCDSTIATTALPSEYLAKELKFKIDRFLIDIADTVKMDNLKFVLYGNPRFISLLDPNVKWVFRTGDRIGGVKLDYSYGVMTSGETSIYVVSTKKRNAKKHRTLRLIPFGDSGETITFKRYKFSTDIVTSKESAYKDTERVGGSQTYVWGTSRYKDVTLQGIQGDISFKNADFINL